MDGPLVHCISQQALYWEVPGFIRAPALPRKDKLGRHIKKDLQRLELTWEEAEEAALDRRETKCSTTA